MIDIAGENQIFSVLIKLPLWFIVGENNFHIWNSETQNLQSYSYHEIEVEGKNTGSADSLQNPIQEIELLLPSSQKYTINITQNAEQEFNHFYLTLLGQIAANVLNE